MLERRLRWFGLWGAASALILGSSIFPKAGIAADAAHPYRVIQRIPLGGDGGWDYLSMDSKAQRLFISRGARVDVVDVVKGAVCGQIPNTPGVHGIALAEDCKRGFTSNGGDNTVTMFDLKTLNVISRIPVGTRPDCIIYDPFTHRVFTFNGGSNDSTAIDAKTGTVVGTIPLGGKPEFAVPDGRGSVFVNLEDESKVAEIDAKNLRLKNNFSIAPGDGPSGIAMDQKHRRVFSVCGNQMMTVLNVDTGKVVATPAIGRGPDAAAFDSEEELAFSSNGGDATLTIVSENSKFDQYSIVQTLTTEPGARTMAIDQSTHRIYLVTAQVAPGNGGFGGGRRRRSFVPGSFVLLVVGR